MDDRGLAASARQRHHPVGTEHHSQSAGVGLPACRSPLVRTCSIYLSTSNKYTHLSHRNPTILPFLHLGKSSKTYYFKFFTTSKITKGVAGCKIRSLLLYHSLHTENLHSSTLNKFYIFTMLFLLPASDWFLLMY